MKNMKAYFIPKLKFALTSSVATLVDYILYLLLVYYLFSPTVSNLISYSTGMLINFYLQRKFIFELNRKAHAAFLMSISFSIVGVGLSTLIIYLLSKVGMISEYQFIIKLITTGMMFFYNFYTKRFAFEKKRLMTMD